MIRYSHYSSAEKFFTVLKSTDNHGPVAWSSIRLIPDECAAACCHLFVCYFVCFAFLHNSGFGTRTKLVLDQWSRDTEKRAQKKKKKKKSCDFEWWFPFAALLFCSNYREHFWIEIKEKLREMGARCSNCFLIVDHAFRSLYNYVLMSEVNGRCYLAWVSGPFLCTLPRGSLPSSSKDYRKTPSSGHQLCLFGQNKLRTSVVC